MWAHEALPRFIDEVRRNTYKDIRPLVLDIGGGYDGDHGRAFREAGFDTMFCNPAIGCTWPDGTNEIPFDNLSSEAFDAIWTSHTLEHSPIPGHFLKRVFQQLRHRGIFCVTVPPRKDELVGGHLSLWTPGLLIYHLILAGFDCRHIRLGCYGYNISVIVQKGDQIKLPPLAHDHGDITRLSEFFPIAVQDGIAPWFPNQNWMEVDEVLSHAKL